MHFIIYFYCAFFSTFFFSFPVEENAAIYAFVARIDNEREIIAELKEKKTAQREYTEALVQGHGAYLLEQNEESNDIFIVSVGAYVINLLLLLLLLCKRYNICRF